MIGEHDSGDPAGQSSFLGGRYRLIRPIGSGGMALVWEARDEVLGRTVAVKVLAGRHLGDPQSRELIRHEARAAAALSHPNICQVYDYGETETKSGTFPYVVMELIRGDTLQTRASELPVTPRFAMQVCAEVAAALGAAHAEGIVHRDVKPANVMLAGTGAKVVDFGIAAAVAPGNNGEDDFEVLGTPAYLAPERLISDVVEPASDVYALAILLYQLLAGCLPWSSETTTQMLTAHIWVDPEPLGPTAGVPRYVVDLCNRCLAKDPTLRPSAREVSAVLTKAAQADPPPDETPSTPPLRAALPAPGLSEAASPPADWPAPGSAGGLPVAGSSAGGLPAARSSSGLPAPGSSAGGLAAAGTSNRLPVARSASDVRATGSSSSSPAAESSGGSPVARSAGDTSVVGLPANDLSATGSPAVGRSAAPGPSPDFDSIDENQGHAGPVDNRAASAGRSGDGAARTPRAFPVRRWTLAATAAVALIAVAWAVWPEGDARDTAAAGASANGAQAVRSEPAPSGEPSIALSSAAAGPAPGRRAEGTPIATGTPTANGTPAPSATAAPTRTNAPTTSPPATADPVVHKLTSAGGTVKAICPQPGVARIRSAKAAKPFKLLSFDTKRGPAPAAVFENGPELITMTITCEGNVPTSTTTVSD